MLPFQLNPTGSAFPSNRVGCIWDKKRDQTFQLSYEQTTPYHLWNTYDNSFNYTKGDTVFIYTSIFAPTDLKESVQHHWEWYNSKTKTWNLTDTISYDVTGGLQGGFLGIYI